MAEKKSQQPIVLKCSISLAKDGYRNTFKPIREHQKFFTKAKVILQHHVLIVHRTVTSTYCFNLMNLPKGSCNGLQYERSWGKHSMTQFPLFHLQWCTKPAGWIFLCLNLCKSLIKLITVLITKSKGQCQCGLFPRNKTPTHSKIKFSDCHPRRLYRSTCWKYQCQLVYCIAILQFFFQDKQFLDTCILICFSIDLKSQNCQQMLEGLEIIHKSPMLGDRNTVKYLFIGSQTISLYSLQFKIESQGEQGTIL